jgi:hypothetical protein
MGHSNMDRRTSKTDQTLLYFTGTITGSPREWIRCSTENGADRQFILMCVSHSSQSCCSWWSSYVRLRLQRARYLYSKSRCQRTERLQEARSLLEQADSKCKKRPIFYWLVLSQLNPVYTQLQHIFLTYVLTLASPLRYWLDGPGIECRWGRDLPHPSRPALGPTQPPTPTQWVSGLFPGGKKSGRSVALTTCPISCGG